MRQLAHHLADLPLDVGFVCIAFSVEHIGIRPEAKERRHHQCTDFAELVAQMGKPEDGRVFAVTEPANPEHGMLEVTIRGGHVRSLRSGA